MLLEYTQMLWTSSGNICRQDQAAEKGTHCPAGIISGFHFSSDHSCPWKSENLFFMGLRLWQISTSVVALTKSLANTSVRTFGRHYFLFLNALEASRKSKYEQAPWQLTSPYAPNRKTFSAKASIALFSASDISSTGPKVYWRFKIMLILVCAPRLSFLGYIPSCRHHLRE